MGRLFREFNDEKWEQVRTHPYFKTMREKTIALADEYCVTDPPRIKFSEIHLFATIGDRKIFESSFGNHENRMVTLFLTYLITNDDKYIEPLTDIIWNILDFETWTIPAHVKESYSTVRRRQQLDLTSTILGFRLAEIAYFIGDKLPELVTRRIRDEVRFRTIESYKKYKNGEFHWRTVTNNWSSVCVGACLCAFLYLATDEEIQAELPSMMATADCYLKGFEEDGCCLEGYSYWNYGFSFYMLFASMLRDYTDGEIDLFKNEKVHKIALFQQSICINKNECLSFSDCGNSFKPAGWITHYLKNIYPDMAIPAIPPVTSASGPLRYALWQDPDLADCEMKPTNHIFHNAQWFLYHNEDAGYSLGCKAGFNGEPHNHMDVGSFLVSKNGKVTFNDPGTGKYSAQYFSERRYELFLTSSRGHSVPIVNGGLQVRNTKADRADILIEQENRYAFTMHKAYADDTLISLVRDFNCVEDGVLLTDKFEFSEDPGSIVERFVSLLPLSEGRGELICGDSVLLFDPELYELTLGSEEVERNNCTTDTVYYADLRVLKPGKETLCEFKII